MNYIERLKAITTIEELFKLREELKIIADVN
jgi:hypothetical protein